MPRPGRGRPGQDDVDRRSHPHGSEVHAHRDRGRSRPARHSGAPPQRSPNEPRSSPREAWLRVDDPLPIPGDCGVWPLARGISRCRLLLRPGSGHERAAPEPGLGMGGCIVSSLGRCGGLRGRRWAAAGDHRGSIRASVGAGTGEESPSRHGARGTPHGPSSARPPAKSSRRERDRRNDHRATFTGRRFVSPSLRDLSERAGRIASGVPGTRRARPWACSRRPPPGADRSGRLALIAWFETTYLGGAPSRSGPCHRSGFRPRRAGRPRLKPSNRSGRKRASRRDRGDGPGAGHLGPRDGYYGITPDPASAGPQGVSSSSPSSGIRSDRPSARSLSRSVFRVIPRSRAAWSLLPSVDPSTSGRRSRSSCWCASW
jgi:hypothetical protein